MKCVTDMVIKIRIGDSGNCYWKTLMPNKIYDLSRKIIQTYKLKTITEGKVKDKKVETKQFEKKKDNSEYRKKLIAMKGIGIETVKDIISVYPFEDDLIRAINDNHHIPFKEDVVMRLKQEYVNRA